MDRSKLVVVQTYFNEINAEIAKHKLASFGIEAFISKDDEGGMIPSMQQTLSVKLEVLGRDRNKAEKILKETNK